MNELTHIIDRAIIHFTAATSLVLSVAVGLRFLAHKTKSRWFPRSMHQTLVFAALMVFSISTLREAYDVANGQPPFKAVADYFSWLLGTGFGAFGLYRWYYYTWE